MGGYFLDLQPLIDSDSNFDLAGFWLGSLSAMEDTEGRVLGLPMTLFLRGIFYDKSAFDAANFSLSHIPSPAGPGTISVLPSLPSLRFKGQILVLVMRIGLLLRSCSR